jgi:hypothetical protein
MDIDQSADEYVFAEFADDAEYRDSGMIDRDHTIDHLPILTEPQVVEFVRSIPDSQQVDAGIFARILSPKQYMGLVNGFGVMSGLIPKADWLALYGYAKAHFPE